MRSSSHSFATRKAYARFANAEFLQLQHKWEELQECLTRYPIPDRNAEADQRHADLNDRNEHHHNVVISNEHDCNQQFDAKQHY